MSAPSALFPGILRPLQPSSLVPAPGSVLPAHPACCIIYHKAVAAQPFFSFEGLGKTSLPLRLPTPSVSFWV